MSRRRVPGIFLLFVAAALLFGTARGRGQDGGARRIVLQSIGLPGVDRGLSVIDAGPPATGTRTRYQPGRVIVKFKTVASTNARISTLAAVARSSSIATRPAYADFDIVNIDPGEDPEQVARALGERADVEYAQAAYKVYSYAVPDFVPNDTFYSRQWNFPQIDLERAWGIQKGGASSVVVAVVDSGIAFQDTVIQFRAFPFCSFDPALLSCPAGSGGTNYPGLGNVIVPFARAPDLATSADRFVAPHDFIWDDSQPLDLEGHGTHVAGTIGQLTDNNSGVAGIAFNVRLMPVKVISGPWDDIFSSPNVGTDDVVARGIRYAADNGAKVINMSIGRSGSPAPVVEDAVRYAVAKGCFVAIAGGNDFEDGNPTEVLAEIASRVKGAVSVSAVDRSKNRAFYSTTGSFIELAAPGGSSRTNPGGDGLVFQQTYNFDFSESLFGFPPPLSQYRAPRFDVFAIQGIQGSSMATPHVSGLAALLMSQGLTDPAAIEAAMERFATDLGTAGRDNEFGFGQINARETLRGLGLAR
jgi:serine protease